MISAFGVDHGGISKALKPQHIQALTRAKANDDLMAWKKSSYAGDRLALHSFPGRRPLPIMGEYHKKAMKRMTRTRRGDRDKNRKAVFGG